jgi:hypothetical protein
MLQAVEKHAFDTVRTDTVWWPDSILEQPFGVGTKVYQAKEAINLLYDLE